MPHSEAIPSKSGARRTVSVKPKAKRYKALESRYTVALSSAVAEQVKRYAGTFDVSMRKAIALPLRLGLEGQEKRKREFFKKLKENLAAGDPQQEDLLVDEFRALMLGR